MALQKRRLGRTRVNHRRTAWMRQSGNQKPLVQSCPNCGGPRVSHRVCMSCGFYGGQEVMKVKQNDLEE